MKFSSIFSHEIVPIYQFWSNKISSLTGISHRGTLPLIPNTNPITSLNPHILAIPIDTFPSPYLTLQYSLRTTLSSTQATYLVTQVKSFVPAFALHSHNSFIHPLTFRNADLPLSASYADALSICARPHS